MEESFQEFFESVFGGCLYMHNTHDSYDGATEIQQAEITIRARSASAPIMRGPVPIQHNREKTGSPPVIIDRYEPDTPKTS